MSQQSCTIPLRYPDIKPGMSREDFKKWTSVQLREFLGDRCVNKDGNKEKLVNNTYGAYMMNLPANFTDAQSEQEELKRDYRSKLSLEDGMLNLPDPRSLNDGWVEAPINIPDTTYENIIYYLRQGEAGKAYKGGKSLLESGHVTSVMTHSVSPNIRYCFVRGICCPEQKISKDPYDVWLCLHKDTGEVVTGDCTCTAGVTGICKHAGALSWYVEREVRLGNNRTCTSKTQKWSLPSKKQLKLHAPETINNIEIKNPKYSRILGSTSTNQMRRSQFDPRAIHHRKALQLSDSDIDTLATLTKGNCGLVMLMRNESTCSQDIASEVEVETSDHVEKPKAVEEVCKEITNCSYEDLMNALKVSPEQQLLIQKLTLGQSSVESADIWFDYRRGRITASIFRDIVSKVNEDMNIVNPHRSKALLSKVCGYYPNFKSKAMQWGIANESVARKQYKDIMTKEHVKLSLKEGGFFVDLEHPFLGASPDGLVSCRCHGEGVLEIKCPWTHRALPISEYALQSASCLEIVDSRIMLKREHSYFYQVQCQMHVTRRKWCDFFVCTTKDSFQERIEYDEIWFDKCIKKAQVVYTELVMPELFTRRLQYDMQVEKDAKTFLLALVNKIV